MTEVPEVKLILTLTIVFVIGMFVFIVIFRAIGLVQDLQTNLMSTETELIDEGTMSLLETIPWALGALYLVLVSVIGYFMYKKYKKEQEPRPPTGYQ